MVTFIFTCKPLGHKEVEDLVKYDPGEQWEGGGCMARDAWQGTHGGGCMAGDAWRKGWSLVKYDPGEQRQEGKGLSWRESVSGGRGIGHRWALQIEGRGAWQGRMAGEA